MNSPRWSEAEPGVRCKKMGVPGGGQQKPLTRNGVPIVSCFARRGDCLRGVLSRMRWIKIENGIGIGHGFGTFAPFGDGAFWGASVPRFPCTFGAAVTWGYSRYGPSGAHCLRDPLSPGPIVSGTHCLRDPLSPGPIVSGAHCLRGPFSAGPIVSGAHCLRGPLSPGPLGA